jgi:hypothetical protein
MKDIGAFFFLSESYPFKKNKIYYCIYAKSDHLRKINPSIEKGKILFVYYDESKAVPSFSSYLAYDFFLRHVKEQLDYEKYTPEELHHIMEKKCIHKKVNWFKEKYAFIENQLK